MSQIHMQVNNLTQKDISFWGHPYFCDLVESKVDQTKAGDSGLRITSMFV